MQRYNLHLSYAKNGPYYARQIRRAIRMLDIVLQNGGNDGSLPHVNMKIAAQGDSSPRAALAIVSEKRYLKITLSRSSSCSPRRPRATMTPSGSMRRLSGIERTP